MPQLDKTLAAADHLFRVAVAYDRYVADFYRRLKAGAVGGAPVGVREFEGLEYPEIELSRDAQASFDNDVGRLRAICGAERCAALLYAYDVAVEALGEDWEGTPVSLIDCATGWACCVLSEAIDEEGRLRRPVAAGVAAALESRGFWRDDAESNLGCVGYSRFLQVAAKDGSATYQVYSFVVLDDDGFSAYASSKEFRRVSSGHHVSRLEGRPDIVIEADGIRHLSVTIPGVPTAVGPHLDALFAEVARVLDGEIVADE